MASWFSTVRIINDTDTEQFWTVLGSLAGLSGSFMAADVSSRWKQLNGEFL